MIIKCPKCEYQYDIEMDDVVVEMTFSCPNCKHRFKVRNLENTTARPVSIQRESDESRFQPRTTPFPQEEPKSEKGIYTEPQNAHHDAVGKEKSHPKPKRNVIWAAMIICLIIIPIVVFLLQKNEGLNKITTVYNPLTKPASIMLVVDISTSMLAEDLKPNRIEAAKSIARKIIESHPKDSIGVIAFAGESFTVMPMAEIIDSLMYDLDGVDIKIAQDSTISDGTAIGMGIANATYYLNKSQADHKMIILITDGANNMGEVSPMMATELARMSDISIYAIGMGADGITRYPVQTGGITQYVNLHIDVDTVMLRNLAHTTDGQFFRVRNNDELETTCSQINWLENQKEKHNPTRKTNGLQISKGNAQRILNAVSRKDRQIQKRIKK